MYTIILCILSTPCPCFISCIMSTDYIRQWAVVLFFSGLTYCHISKPTTFIMRKIRSTCGTERCVTRNLTTLFCGILCKSFSRFVIFPNWNRRKESWSLRVYWISFGACVDQSDCRCRTVKSQSTLLVFLHPWGAQELMRTKQSQGMQQIYISLTSFIS